MAWTVVVWHTPAECDVTGGIADWGIGMIVTSEFGDATG
jgi:hypothetical protein